jgi:ubiquinone/menaquinone biosynthesis C-methylase UbiE
VTGQPAASIYDRPFVAALYDLDVRLTSRHLWGTSVADQVKFARDVASTADGGRLLEVPAGTGLVMDAALASCTARPAVVAADRSIAMLRRARGRLGARAAYVVADVGQLPFRDGAFAAVHSGNGFHLFPDRAQAAAEISRTLERGGLAAITTWTNHGKYLARAYQRVLRRLGQITEPVSAEEHSSTFQRAGLVERSWAMGGTLLRWTGERT